MKIAPLVRALRADGRLGWQLIHTGQHYDRDMNDVFFEELGIPKPDVFMGCGGGSHAEQTAKVMVGFEALCLERKPDCVLVVGDVNSTLACAIVAKKLQIPVAHVEAGLRSGDRSMPEEINRLVTDAISDLFFVTEPSGVEHLVREGKSLSAVHHVGHVMADNVLYQAAQSPVVSYSAPCEVAEFKELYGRGRYGVITLHRPSNVDDGSTFSAIGGALREFSRELPLIFPVHPRTRSNLERFGIDLGARITLVGPQPYMSFLNLWKDAGVVLTDSGGLQEETTVLGVPCLTLRENTERPITLDEGTNVLVGTNPHAILREARAVLAGRGKCGRRPKLWDGRAAERIVSTLVRELGVI